MGLVEVMLDALDLQDDARVDSTRILKEADLNAVCV
jgi:predicted transcriptional regulator